MPPSFVQRIAARQTVGEVMAHLPFPNLCEVTHSKVFYGNQEFIHSSLRRGDATRYSPRPVTESIVCIWFMVIQVRKHSGTATTKASERRTLIFFVSGVAVLLSQVLLFTQSNVRSLFIVEEETGIAVTVDSEEETVAPWRGKFSTTNLSPGVWWRSHFSKKNSNPDFRLLTMWRQ